MRRQGLYAFVEGDAGASEDTIRDFMEQSLGRAKAPERLQLVEALLRRADARRTEILQLVATIRSTRSTLRS